MRKLVITSTIFLTISGIVLAYPRLFPWADKSSAIYLLHLWVGFFFLVIFPIYSWDHIKKNVQRLKKISFLTISGITQFLTGLGLIISGMPLLIFGKEVLRLVGQVHLILTFVLIASLILHKFSKK